MRPASPSHRPDSLPPRTAGPGVRRERPAARAARHADPRAGRALAALGLAALLGYPASASGPSPAAGGPLPGAAPAALPAGRAQDPPPAAPAAVEARVLEVFDGDTLRVRIGTTEETVRLLGVDCPELSHPNRPVEFYAAEAAAFARQMVGDRSILLSADALGDERDTYSRLLRYVSLPESPTLNELLIGEGYCYALTRFRFSRRAEFRRLEEAARRRGGRLWEDGGLAELRWIEGHGALPIGIYPMTRQSWGVRFGDRVLVRLSHQELVRALETIRSGSAGLSPRELDAKLEKEGWRRLEGRLPEAIHRRE